MGWICSKCGLKYSDKKDADRCCSKLLKGNWKDLPLKNEVQCEYCNKFFLDIEKHKDRVHGKGQTKLNEVTK